MNRMREEISKSALAPARVLEGEGRQSFCFNENFVGFAGHFPDYPILPAVLQLLMAQLLAEQVCGEPLEFLTLKRAKFTRQIRSGEQIDVVLKSRKIDDQLHCTTELRVENESAASFKLVLGKGTTV